MFLLQTRAVVVIIVVVVVVVTVEVSVGLCSVPKQMKVWTYFLIMLFYVLCTTATFLSVTLFLLQY
jgi:hypothetical protein